MITLFYLSLNTTGGWVTFTAHLVNSLLDAGEQVQLLKIGNRSEGFERDFGYGVRYRNVSLEQALVFAKHDPSIIVAAAKQRADEAKALIGAGARVVLHDPTELKAGLAGVAVEKPWVIRKAVQQQVPGSVFIRHPYVRRPRPSPLPKKGKKAVAISRIDFDKHTEILLDANRLGAGIEIRGFENRLYTKFKILPNYPEWEQSKAHYHRDIDEAFRLLLGAKFMPDMSVIKGDGGGTQYTFLEAWDAGAVPIIHADWYRRNDDMKPCVNCLMVVDGAHLAVTLRNAKEPQRLQLVAGGETALKRHRPKIIVPQVKEWLQCA